MYLNKMWNENQKNQKNDCNLIYDNLNKINLKMYRIFRSNYEGNI